MSDVQPGVYDVVIHRTRGGYAVSMFCSTCSQTRCATYSAALTIAEERARRENVDIWFDDDDALWRVRRYRAGDDVVRQFAYA